jgi:outer membrane cobalamin receptor
VSEHTRVRGGTGIYRQFPDLDQVFGIHGGGLDLRPERALHLDAGIEQALPGQTRVLVNVYSRRERDVMWTPGAEPRLLPSGAIRPGTFDAPWVNALSGEARGVEVVVRREATGGFSGFAGYAFGRLKYTDTATGETFWGDADQRHTLSLSGSYRLRSRTSVSARYRYGSNYPVVGYIGLPAGVLRLATERNTLRLPPYSRLDLRADRAFTWSSRRLVVFGAVANVLDHENVRNTSYAIDGAGRVVGRAGSLLPFVPSAGLVVEF